MGLGPELRPQRPSTAEAFALGVVAAVLAALVVPLWVLWDWKAKGSSKAFSATSQAFFHSPEFVLWLLILAGQAAVWVGAGWLVVTTLSRRVRDLRRLGSLPRGTAAAIVGSTAVLALAAFVLLFGPRLGLAFGFNFGHYPGGPNERNWPFSHHDLRLGPLFGIGLLIGFLAIAAMWLAAVGLDDLALRARARVSHVRRFVALRSELTVMLAVAGVLIGLGTLSTGALRAAVVATNDEPFSRRSTVTCLVGEAGATRSSVLKDFDRYIADYPDCRLEFDHQYVLAYGLLFSGLLAIAFAPSF